MLVSEFAVHSEWRATQTRSESHLPKVFLLRSKYVVLRGIADMRSEAAFPVKHVLESRIARESLGQHCYVLFKSPAALAAGEALNKLRVGLGPGLGVRRRSRFFAEVIHKEVFELNLGVVMHASLVLLSLI
jgi:hypothetical protein